MGQGNGSKSSKSNKYELHSLPSVLSSLSIVSSINWMAFVTAKLPSSLRPPFDSLSPEVPYTWNLFSSLTLINHMQAMYEKIQNV